MQVFLLFFSFFFFFRFSWEAHSLSDGGGLRPGPRGVLPGLGGGREPQSRRRMGRMGRMGENPSRRLGFILAFLVTPSKGGPPFFQRAPNGSVFLQDVGPQKGAAVLLLVSPFKTTNKGDQLTKDGSKRSKWQRGMCQNSGLVCLCIPISL